MTATLILVGKSGPAFNGTQVTRVVYDATETATVRRYDYSEVTKFDREWEIDCAIFALSS